MFPLDWVEWHREWSAWIDRHHELVLVPKKIPGKNFLADEILGTFKVRRGRTVELSEVVFPNLTERDAATGRLLETQHRGVGLTWADDRSGTVVHSFEELEQELEL